MIERGTIVFALLAAITIRYCSAQQGCSIQMTGELPDYQPLLIGSNQQIYLPSSDGFVKLPTGGSIRLVCTGLHNQFNKYISSASDISVRCEGGTNFIYNFQRHNFTDFKCKNVAEYSVYLTDKQCKGRNNPNSEYLVEIGFEVNRRFGNILMQICFDSEALSVLWTSHKIVSVIKGAQAGYSRTTFRDIGFFDGIDVDLLYKQNEQNKTFTRLLGPIRTRSLLNFQSLYYLARGHLTAKTDFVYGSQQDGTFAYINVAPQWQIINQGNWLKVEKKVRELAHNLSSDLEIHTGVYGVLEFLNDLNEPTSLYLHYQPGEYKRHTRNVPVPTLFWKTVTAPGLETVTIVCVNNPYATLDEDKEEIVDDANNDYNLPGCRKHSCNDHAWLRGTFDYTDSRLGIIYCC